MSCEAQSVTDAVIRADGLGKFYPETTPRGMIRYLLPVTLRPRPRDFWALRGATFTVTGGRVLGLIGQNGCGKSTLLKMIAGLLAPSEGSLEVTGKVAALLELGAGFDPDFTGRENVLLSGAIYGYTRQEMEEKFEDIVAFAEIGPHLDHPVKTYSSGMFARLAFAVAIQVNPQILLVDEILSVGDVGFQARCFQRIEALRAEGTTIVFVSHDMSAVRMLCDEVLLLDGGRILQRGPPHEVTEAYYRLLTHSKAAQSKVKMLASSARKHVEFGEVLVEDEGGEPVRNFRSGGRYRVRCEITFLERVERPIVSLQLKTVMGFVVYDQNTMFTRQIVPPCSAGDRLEAAFDLRLSVCPGPFRMGVGVASLEGELPRPLGGSELLAFEVLADKPAFGVANLEADITVRALGAAS
jgi:ABC-type polysaccharide/polyol phosphate transport system ATPase subunit